MLGQNETISDITALIQERVGIFLQLRSQLLEMQRSPVLTISDVATQLLVSQSQLETDLPNIIVKAQSGNVSDVISATGSYILIEKQINDVNDLENKYLELGESAKSSFISGIPNWLLWIGGGLIVVGLAKRKKRII